MKRTIEHKIVVHRAFDDICYILDRRAAELLGNATTAASRRSTALVEAADQELPGFDASEDLLIEVAPLCQDQPRHARIEFRWEANPTKRLLANVDARLDIRPVVSGGAGAITELFLRAHYAPSANTRRRPETALFGRGIVDAALHRLLQSLATDLEEYEESIFV